MGRKKIYSVHKKVRITKVGGRGGGYSLHLNILDAYAFKIDVRSYRISFVVVVMTITIIKCVFSHYTTLRQSDCRIRF